MQIGYLVPQFPGQTHTFFWREIKVLEKLGVQVSLFSTRLPPRNLISHDWSDEAISRTEYLGKIRPLKTLRALPKIFHPALLREVQHKNEKIFKDLIICAAAALQLARSCQAQGIAHVHVHSCGRMALIAALASQMSDLRYSLTLHGPLSDYGNGQGFKWRNAEFATVITQKLKDEITPLLGNDLPDRIVIQSMGVDVDFLSRTQPYKGAKAGGRLKVFSCGRLNIVKGHQDLIMAVLSLRDQGHDVQLEIAGEDDDGGTGYRKSLEKLIAKHDLEQHVRLLGAISETEVKQKLLGAHIFVLASWHEPLGVAYMEAMSCGVPTIGTDSGGVVELITHGKNGVVVPPKNARALADAMLDLWANPAKARALGEHGRLLVVEKFGSGIGARTLRDEICRDVQSSVQRRSITAISGPD